mmetsp:Transcript_21629/g.61547  ORF Transcript_21629/g.61547 Transcript_21629/m.61547 type:complete len:109 (+) Transcript_21629:129-455(+)
MSTCYANASRSVMASTEEGLSSAGQISSAADPHPDHPACSQPLTTHPPFHYPSNLLIIWPQQAAIKSHGKRVQQQPAARLIVCLCTEVLSAYAQRVLALCRNGGSQNK